MEKNETFFRTIYNGLISVLKILMHLGIHSEAVGTQRAMQGGLGISHGHGQGWQGQLLK